MRRLLRTFVPLLAIALLISCTENSAGPDSDNEENNGGDEPATYTIDVSKSPSDAGSIEPSTNETYEEGETAELVVNSDEGFRFTEWTGDMESSENPLTFTVDQNYELTANFEKKSYELTVNKEGEGAVNEEIVQEKSTDYEHGTVVELTANPTEGWQFEEWQGALTGTENPQQITVDEAKEVTAIFKEKNTEPPVISSVSPQEGTVGTEVTIEGSNFSSTNSENTVTFNGTEASVRALEDVIYTQVPEEATDGPIKVEVNGKRTTGPDFEVFPAPTISSVSPEEGEVGTEVTITGENFRPTASKNTVTIDDIETPIKEATSTQIITEVPEGAEYGTVDVTIGEQTARGPYFDVLFLGDLEVTTSTSGSDQDYNGYTLTVDISADNEKTVSIGLDETVTIKDLEVDSYSFELSGVASNCSRSGSNSRVEIQEDQVATLELDITCEATGAPSDQGKLVYVSGSTSGDNIKISNIDGSAVDNITNNSDYDSKPVVSPDGEHIAFLSDPDGNDNLFVMDITGENIQKIADNDSDGFEYSWSPDGSELAIIDNNEAYIINRDGSNRRFLADNVSEVDWSPDGSEIALTEVESENVKFVSPDGNEVRSFSIATVSRFDGIDYAPDGSELMVTARTSDEEAKLYFVNTDGSNEQLIFRSMNEIYTHPGWSPDGSRFVYQKIRTSPTYSSDMLVVDIESGERSEPHRLSDVSEPFWTPVLE